MNSNTDPIGELMSTSVASTPPRSRRFAKRVAFAIDDLRPPNAGTVVLAYHRVGRRTASPVDISSDAFRSQMAHLRANAEVATIDEFAQHARCTGAQGEIDLHADPALEKYARNAVVLTFDDGTADFLDEVVPVLVQYQLPATVYVATEFIDSQMLFPLGGVPISWAGLREAVSTGFVTVGAHTHSHRLLDRCSVAEAIEELDRSNARIEDELGIAPRHFAYPKAVAATGAVAAEVAARYETAAIAGTRPNVYGETDLQRVQRSPIQVLDGWDGFRRKVDGGMSTEDDLRRILNRVRYRGLTR